MKILSIFCSLLFPLFVHAQHHDNVSLIGYYGGFITPPGDNLGISVLSFPDGSLQVEENFELPMYFDAANAPFSDSNGNLQCYSNGVSIMNTYWDTIIGGATLTTDRPAAAIWPQFALALPHPGHPGPGIDAVWR